ncbi:MAG: sensor domain-containing diguanylate cyclase [Terracidiphilus sp.]|jgi:diguanylate cyclase (GGDEF)-like protein
MANDAEGRIPLADLLVFHQLARSLTSSFDLDTILRTILDQMEKMVDAELWALLMLDEARQELYYAIAAGEAQAALSGLRVKVGEGMAGWVVQHGETLIVPEAEHDPLVKESKTPGVGAVSSAIALPLRGRKGTQGVIEIFNPRAQMSDYSIAFLHILADHAAIAIENARDVARIQQLTITDDTTGLYNLRHLYDVMERELESDKKPRKPLSLAFFDLDHFKLVNDAHGHLIGSELLAHVGRRFQELSRKHDLCFRYGGDEFVILMPGADAGAAMELTRAMNAALMETEFRMKTGLKLSIGASAGLASSPDDGVAVHEIIGIADIRMYWVKRHGRGQVRGA